jgi:hypothetical protein
MTEPKAQSHPNQTSKKLRKGSNAKAPKGQQRKSDQRMTSRPKDSESSMEQQIQTERKVQICKEAVGRHEQELTSQRDREKREMEPEDCLGMLFTPLEVFTATRNRRQFG